MPEHNLEYLILNSRRLTPAGHSLLQCLAVKRAKALRAEFLHELWRRVRSWRQHRVALTQLRAMDDAALKDIGLHRSGIEAAVMNAPPVALRPAPACFPRKAAFVPASN